ncbi:MAG TPA: PIG-L family deacetylase, partial [bacterium]|nr:PIG-L family deacetylase [bacterium]
MSSRRFSARPGRVALVLSVVVLFLITGPAVRSIAQVRAVPLPGAAGILHQVLKLRTTASVLLVGAHPDDEDSLFIARAARGDHARVAYFSLTRGEGGQNAIGPELFDALGVIRTEELLQARTLDGGEQFFGRAVDYGFSKSREEAAAHWGEREVLGDIVRVIRIFRPLVVYSIFSGTPADGHGHHQLVGRLTPVAFHAAADPAQFPEQIAEGLRPWQARKLYRGTGLFALGGGPGTTLRVEEGQVDPLLGRSYAEVAAEGRSQHKTQGQGFPELQGPVQSGLALLESAAPDGSA